MCLPLLGLPGEMIRGNGGESSWYGCIPTPGLVLFVMREGPDEYCIYAGNYLSVEEIAQSPAMDSRDYCALKADCQLQAVGIIHHLIAEYKAGNLKR